jgi:DNA replication protein DnaC
MNAYEEMSSLLEDVNLHVSGEELAYLASEASKEKCDSTEFLLSFITHLRAQRNAKQHEWLLRKSRIEKPKCLDEFDFSFQPELRETQIRELARLGFLKSHENIILLGLNGRGKSHIATALGMECIKEGKRVLMVSQAQMIEHLLNRIRVYGSISSRSWATCILPDVLIIDDAGNRKVDRTGSELFAEVVARRHEKGSIIVTSTKPFSEWPIDFTPEPAAEAVGKLVHHLIRSFHIV